MRIKNKLENQSFSRKNQNQAVLISPTTLCSRMSYLNYISFFIFKKAQQLMKKFTKRNPKQIYIMKLHESPRPDMSISFVNRKYIPE